MSALTKALILARLELKHGTVFKGAQNSHQKYAYVSHEGVVTCGARDALLKHGLVLEQRSMEYVGPIEKAQLWRGTHALVHDESGEERIYTFCATTQANDKAAMVASTTLDKTAILRVLQLAGSAEDDAEHDAHDRRTPEPPKPAQAPAQAPQNKRTQVDSTTFLDAAFAGLKDAETDQQLATWVRRVDNSQAEPEAKAVAFKAFEKRCLEVGLIATEVAGKARAR